MLRPFACSLVLLLLVTPGCLRVGQASRDETDQLEFWSKLVSDRDRSAVQHEADQHTDWMQKKKVAWMTMQYRARYRRAQAASQPTTTPASQPTTAPTTIPSSAPATTRSS